jgi:ABC-type branched-subunit amino acid transport system substrate-binding protein
VPPYLNTHPDHAAFVFAGDFDVPRTSVRFRTSAPPVSPELKTSLGRLPLQVLCISDLQAYDVSIMAIYYILIPALV